MLFLRRKFYEPALIKIYFSSISLITQNVQAKNDHGQFLHHAMVVILIILSLIVFLIFHGWAKAEFTLDSSASIFMQTKRRAFRLSSLLFLVILLFSLV